MKRFIIAMLICLMVLAPVSAFALWVTANQVTVSWDANDTSALETGERLMYRVYISNIKTDPEKANPVEVGITDQTSLAVTIAQKGKYMAGVQAVLQVLGDDNTTWEEVGVSDISWSDNPAVTKDGLTFGIRFYPSPKQPTGIFPIN